MNNELKKYFNILCNDNYPTFIDKYLKVEELIRLKQIGQFCGCDYNKLYNIRYWYSRFDHSVAVALITWNFTKDEKQTLAALFHDLGTPAFSHCIDFMLGDSINQETSERSIKEVIESSSAICKLLELDGISIDEVTAYYPIVENKSPKLCADRLDGVLHTVHIWLNKWDLEQIVEVYSNLTVLTNEDGLPEIGFRDKKNAELFFLAVYEYSMALQMNEDRYTMQYIADVVKKLLDSKKLNFNDLYVYSEEYIIKLLKENEESWPLFENADSIKRSDSASNFYNVSVASKKRYVMPLVSNENGPTRIDKLSRTVADLLVVYKEFTDSKYAYVEDLIIKG